MAGIPGAAGPGAKFPQWTYNTTTGAIDEVTNATAKALNEADAWPAKLIFFTSDQAARNYAAGTGVGGIDMSTLPGSAQVQSGVNQTTQAVQNAAPSIPGLSQIGTFFSSLGQASTWERAAEVVIGAMLVIAGVSHLFHVKLPSVVPVPA